MRTQAALTRPRLLGAILLSLLAGGALLGGSVPAWAEGRVTFTQMSIERCKGTCTLKLSCGVAGPPTELLSGKQGRVKDLVDIGKSIEIRQFPAEVKCTAYKDTGWIGTTWEEIGTASVAVPQGGDYRLEIDKADLGGIRVMLAVDSLESFLPAAPAAAPVTPAPAKGKKPASAKGAAPLQVAAVFNPDKQGHAVVIGLEWPAFKDRMDKLATQGIKLVDIEVFEDGGKRLWSGIFKNVPDRVVLRANQTWDEFLAQWKQLTGGRARLVDLEIYGDSAKPTFAGLYRDYSEGHTMWVGQERKDMLTKVKELQDYKDLQLVDAEVYHANGKLFYAGAFRHTTGKYALWTNLDRAAFESQWKQGAAKGQQMVDIETYTDGGKRVYDAIVRTGMGGPGDVLLGSDVAGFARRWLDDTGKGQRLVSIEFFRE
jgi:hypothetical protein